MLEGVTFYERKGNQTGGHREDTLQKQEAAAVQEIHMEKKRLGPSLSIKASFPRAREAGHTFPRPPPPICSPGCLCSPLFEIEDALKCLIYAVSAGGNYQSLNSELPSSWFFFTLP